MTEELANQHKQTIALDVETYGVVNAVVEREAAKAEMDPKHYAALHPTLSRVVVVGMINVGSAQALALMNTEFFPEGWETPEFEVEHVAVERFPCERELMQRLNVILGRTRRLITFNGAGFDLPVLMAASVRGRMRPASLLVNATSEPRYKCAVHVDLADQASAVGRARRPSLAALAVGLGYEDPKGGGNGAEVGQLVEQGRVKELIEYCVRRDVMTVFKTFLLYHDLGALLT